MKVMKSTLLLVAISGFLGATPVFAKSELETLRSLCAEQERQIRQLEDENAKLRSLDGLTASRASDKASNSALQAPGSALVSAPISAASPNPAKASSKTYTVLADDTLERVSRKVGVTPTALAAMNGLKVTSTLHEGQKLKVPGSPSPASIAATPAAAPAASAGAAPANPSAVAGKTHKLKDDETFTSIGKKYGIPTATLIAANPTVKPSAMRPGQIINLSMPTQTPGTAAKAPAPEDAEVPPPSPPQEKPVARPPATAAKTPPAPDKTPSAPAFKPLAASASAPATPSAAKKSSASPPGATAAAKSSVRLVGIDGTTTYGEFAAKHGITVARLNELNSLELVDSTILAKGSELNVPAQP